MECCICFEEKNLETIPCNHPVCSDCISRITICPMCRGRLYNELQSFEKIYYQHLIERAKFYVFLFEDSTEHFEYIHQFNDIIYRLELSYLVCNYAYRRYYEFFYMHLAEMKELLDVTEF